MNYEVYNEEMLLFGCIELYHPLKPGFFYVIEQKLDTEGNGFASLENGAYAFFISPNLVKAERLIFNTSKEVLSFIQRMVDVEGYTPNLHTETNDDLLKIPKTDFVKWQISSRIRYVIPQ